MYRNLLDYWRPLILITKFSDETAAAAHFFVAPNPFFFRKKTIDSEKPFSPGKAQNRAFFKDLPS